MSGWCSAPSAGFAGATCFGGRFRKGGEAPLRVPRRPGRQRALGRVMMRRMTETKLVGVDVGGTFTDLVLVDEATGEVRVAKVPTTMDNQAAGVQAALAVSAADAAELKVIIHGTTTATNALLERKG